MLKISTINFTVILTFYFMTFIKAEEKINFYKGADISMLLKYENDGMEVFHNGKNIDFIELMKINGCNTFRVRKFVHPEMKGGVIQDLEYIIKLGKRIKNSGAKFFLDLHYSDIWADPKQQLVPKKWQNYNFPELLKELKIYTEHVFQKCKDNGCTPDFVQVGNEIQFGILKPYGAFNTTTKWEGFTKILKTCTETIRKISSNTKIVIHSHAGGKPYHLKSFCKRLEQASIDYDILGVSFYSQWQGKISNLVKAFHEVKEFGKPIFVVETAYRYKGKKHWYKGKEDNFEYPFSPEGQAQFLTQLIKTVKSFGAQGHGVLYWYPESFQFQKTKKWEGGGCALFNEEGIPLPAIKAFQK